MVNKIFNKRFVAFLLALLMMFSLCGCGSKENTPSTSADMTTGDVPSDSETSDISSAETMGSPAATETPSPEPISTPTPIPEPTPAAEIVSPTAMTGLSLTKLNCINMLNYMSALMQKVDEQRKNQLFLESAYNSFDNLYPNSVDKDTKALILDVMDTIEEFLMISVKRARLEYIHEQNRAQAMRDAFPNPLGLLSVVQSGNPLKAAVSALYMAIDSSNKYKTATSQADQQFMKDGWELDDSEAATLHKNAKTRLGYLLDQVRTYDLPGDLALSREAIEDFVTWSGKPDSQKVDKISWLESHKETYSVFGPYWLELAKDYYNSGKYEKCLEAIQNYEAVSTRIFRLNIDFASVLPMAIVSARETKSEPEYIKLPL